MIKHRLGDIAIEGVEYGESVSINGVTISFHPAGHIPGSAQIRLEHKGQVWVVSGDYKTEDDGLSQPFEPVQCHVFVTESTFGLPVYRWKNQHEVFQEINDWWRKNKELGKTTLIAGYALGKAQRIIRGLDESIGTIYTHGAVENVNAVLRGQGVAIKETVRVTPEMNKKDFPGNIVVATPSAPGTPWAAKLGPQSTGICSGWMTLRGARRRRAADRGFVLSDHADWQGLNTAVKETGAGQVFVTHGYRALFARWLEEQGLKSDVVETAFEDELQDDPTEGEKE